MTAVYGLLAFGWMVGVIWFIGACRLGSRFDAFELHAQQAIDVSADDWTRWEAEVTA